MTSMTQPRVSMLCRRRKRVCCHLARTPSRSSCTPFRRMKMRPDSGTRLSKMFEPTQPARRAVSASGFRFWTISGTKNALAQCRRSEPRERPCRTRGVAGSGWSWMSAAQSWCRKPRRRRCFRTFWRSSLSPRTDQNNRGRRSRPRGCWPETDSVGRHRSWGKTSSLQPSARSILELAVNRCRRPSAILRNRVSCRSPRSKLADFHALDQLGGQRDDVPSLSVIRRGRWSRSRYERDTLAARSAVGLPMLGRPW